MTLCFHGFTSVFRVFSLHLFVKERGGGALAAGVIQTFSAQNFYLSTGSVQMRQGHLHAIWLKQSLPLLLKMDLAPVEDKRLNYIYDKSAEAVEA